MSYPTTPGFKTYGPSREASVAETDRAPLLREAVAALFRSGQELTADECAAAVGASVLAVRPRLSELHLEGRIEDAGKRRRNASGHTATVWRWRTENRQGELNLLIVNER